MLELTSEQSTVAGLPLNARALVTAGPGTGKTHTLTSRLVHLVDRLGATPGELVAFTFTRAAAGEMRRRLAELGADARAIRPTTLDSFATTLLASWNPDIDWRAKSFDERIVLAIQALSELDDDLATIVHFCVDELQDLVGVRADFIRALITRTPAGFTLFGDPAQGIYNFSLDDRSHATGSPALYGWLRNEVTGLTELELTVNHRAQSARLNGYYSLRAKVTAPSTGTAKYAVVCNALATLPPLPSWDTLGRSTNSAAVLCRTNGSASVTASELRRCNLDVVLRRTGRTRSAPPWLAIVARHLQSGSISKARFEQAFAACAQPLDVNVDDAWRALRRIASARTGIELSRLRQNLNSGGGLDELTPVQQGIVVSTIHRAKGLEFDNVVILDGSFQDDADDLDEEARVLYVALTRARKLVMRTETTTKVRLDHDRGSDRWAVRSWKSDVFTAVELMSSDIDPLSPPGTGERRFDALRAQDLLASKVRPGDSVKLCAPERTRDGGITYLVHWNDEPIAETSESFSHGLRRCRRFRDDYLAQEISEAWIDGVETFAGEPTSTRHAQLGDSGLWLAPRLTGLGRFNREGAGRDDR